MSQNARECQWVGESVHDGAAVDLGNDRLDLGKHPQQRPRQSDDGVVLFGPEFVSFVALAVDGHLPRRPRRIVARQLGPFASVDPATVTDLDANGVGVGLLGVKSAFDEVEGLIDRAVGVDHEVRRETAPGPARPWTVVHRLETRAGVDAAVEVQNQLRDILLELFQAAVVDPLADAVALGLLVATPPILVDATGLIGVESLWVAPEHHWAPDLECLPRDDDGGAGRVSRWFGDRRALREDGRGDENRGDENRSDVPNMGDHLRNLIWQPRRPGA